MRREIMAWQDQWTVLNEYNDGQFDITVDMTYDYNTHPDELYDVGYTDVKEICEKIDDGTYQWFVLRATASINGRDLGVSTLFGNLYENPNDVFEDGVANDIIGEAVDRANEFIADIRKA